MNRNVIFIGGIHGVGKTTLSRRVAERLNIEHFSAGDLIKTLKRDSKDQTSKLVENVRGNQEVLTTAIEQYTKPGSTFLLDGHFSLVDSESQLVTIPIETYQQLSLEAIIMLHDAVEKISHRLRSRDDRVYSIEFLSDFQKLELSYAREVASQLKIPLIEFGVDEDFDKLINFIELL